ncbi:MAG: type III pantothenate kinase, partial [Methylohalobius sp.]|nr:type III pantothenate kinase [Methylohalobius sp.]
MNEPVLLLLDNGNSRLKWAVWRRKGEISPGSPLVTEGKIDLLDLERVFADLPRPSRVLIANVVGPEAEEKLAAFVLGRWRLKPEFVCSQAQGFGVQIGYRKPESLGVD